MNRKARAKSLCAIAKLVAFCFAIEFKHTRTIAAEVDLSARDVILLYRDNLEKQSTIDASVETQFEYVSAFGPRYFKKLHTDCRIKGGQFDFEMRESPELKSLTQVTDASDYQVTQFLWDGGDYYEYHGATQAIVQKNTPKVRKLFVVHSPNAEKSAKEFLGTGNDAALFLGYVEGDTRTLSETFFDSERASVISVNTAVGNHRCIIIQVQNKSGKYVAAFDKEHGYALVQLKVDRSGADVAYGQKVSNFAKHMYECIDNVALTNIGSAWVSTSQDFKRNVTDSDEGRITSYSSHSVRSNVVLEPRFDQSQFVPAFPDGTAVFLPVASGIQFEWRGGKAIPTVDDRVVRSIDRVVAVVKATAGSVGYTGSTAHNPTQSSSKATKWLIGTVIVAILIVCFSMVVKRRRFRNAHLVSEDK